MSRKLFIATCMLPLVVACAPKVVSSDHVEADGNQLIVEEMTGANGSRSIHIRKNTIAWVGKYKGGEEQVADRKKLMLELSMKQANKVCSPNKSIEKSEIDYIMLDKDPMVYGGGLLGYAAAAAHADYVNLPMSSWYHYYCEGETPPQASQPSRKR